MDYDRYCTECGHGLGPEDKFCPACGAIVKDCAEPEPGEGCTVVHAVREDHSDLRRHVMLLTLIWGVLSVLFGAYCLYFGLSGDCIDMLSKTDISDTQTMLDYMEDMGYDENGIEMLYSAIGGAFLVSGLFALLSAHLTYRGQKYRLAWTALLLSAIFSFPLLITFVIGIIVMLYLGKCKDDFES